MGIIIALLMFNCNLHLNQTACLDQHVKCVETMSTIKVGGDLACLNHDQRLAVSYLYCVETGGEVGSDLDHRSILDAMEGYNQYAGFYLWEKPGFRESLQRQIIQSIPKKCN